MEGLGVILWEKRAPVHGREKLASLRRQYRAIFAKGILHGDFAVSKSEQITAVYFDAAAIRSCARERPLRYSSFAGDEVTRIAPMGIVEGGPDFSIGRSHSVTTNKASSTYLGSAGGFEDTVFGHE